MASGSTDPRPEVVPTSVVVRSGDAQGGEVPSAAAAASSPGGKSVASSTAAGRATLAVSFATCALAKKIPKPRSSGNTYKDMQAQMEHHHFVQCINVLDARPDVRAECKSFLDQILDNKSRGELGTVDYFSEVTSLGKLEEAWTLAWVCKVTGFMPNDMGRGKVMNKDILTNVLEFLLNASKTLKLSQSMLRKVIAARAFDSRLELAGNRHLLVRGHQLLKDGQVNYLIFVYKLTFTRDKATSVTHRPSKDVALIPDSVSITKQYDITCNWSDMSAAVVLGTHHNYPLHNFFQKGEGPYKVKCAHGNSKEFNSLVDEAVLAQEKADKAAGQGSALTATDQAAAEYHSPSKDIVKKRLADARQKMREKLAGSEPGAKKQKTSLQRHLSKE